MDNCIIVYYLSTGHQSCSCFMEKVAICNLIGRLLCTAVLSKKVTFFFAPSKLRGIAMGIIRLRHILKGVDS